MAARRQAGREVSKPVDAMIAAVAASRGMAVATRNTSDFDGMGVELINPWQAADSWIKIQRSNRAVARQPEPPNSATSTSAPDAERMDRCRRGT